MEFNIIIVPQMEEGDDGFNGCQTITKLFPIKEKTSGSKRRLMDVGSLFGRLGVSQSESGGQRG